MYLVVMGFANECPHKDKCTRIGVCLLCVCVCVVQVFPYVKGTK